MATASPRKASKKSNGVRAKSNGVSKKTAKTTTKKAKTTNGEAKTKTVAKKSKAVVDLTIPPLKLRTLTVTVKGVTPLITHKFADKSKRQMADAQQGKARNKKAPKDPKADFESGIYYLGGKPKGRKKARYGIPASAFKQAAVTACRYVEGITQAHAKGSFHVLGDPADPALVEIKTKKKPRMREDTVRIGGFGKQVADLRYRPEFENWSVNLLIRYNDSAITPQQIAHLLNVAGFAVGVGEWRPEKTGIFGQFSVV
jgi:hypothetical protein